MSSPQMVLILQNEYSRRRLKNPAYSLRAFSRSLGIPSGRLSELLNGKREITPKLAAQVIKTIALDPQMGESLLQALTAKKNRSLSKPLHGKDFHTLNSIAYPIISDWRHFAILNLVATVDFNSDHKWIASRLGLEKHEIKIVIERLFEAKLIRLKGGKIELTHKHVKTTDQIQNLALRAAHRDHFDRASRALEDIPIALRDFSGMIIPTDMHKIPKAKELIKSFRRKMAGLLENSDSTEVYSLNIQLMPLTTIRRNHD